MKKSNPFCLKIFLFLTLCAPFSLKSFAVSVNPPAPFQEFIKRKGLPNYFAKIQKGDSVKESFLKTEQHGNLPTSVTTMEMVADHYHIPSINFWYEVSKMVSSNQLIMKG